MDSSPFLHGRGNRDRARIRRPWSRGGHPGSGLSLEGPRRPRAGRPGSRHVLHGRGNRDRARIRRPWSRGGHPGRRLAGHRPWSAARQPCADGAAGGGHNAKRPGSAATEVAAPTGRLPDDPPLVDLRALAFARPMSISRRCKHRREIPFSGSPDLPGKPARSQQPVPVPHSGEPDVLPQPAVRPSEDRSPRHPHDRRFAPKGSPEGRSPCTDPAFAS